MPPCAIGSSYAARMRAAHIPHSSCECLHRNNPFHSRRLERYGERTFDIHRPMPIHHAKTP
ncbi:hypothetical protein OH687_14005 [Burkholderia anthina]|nr:hypothetical protein OH687_14005 [Burkholderia anthina]